MALAHWPVAVAAFTPPCAPHPSRAIYIYGGQTLSSRHRHCYLVYFCSCSLCGAVGLWVLSVADQPILLPVPFCASENIISSLLFPSDCCRLSSAPQTIYDSISKCDIRVWYWYCASAAMGPMAMTIWECYVCFSRVYIMLCVCVRCLFMCQKCHY